MNIKWEELPRSVQNNIVDLIVDISYNNIGQNEREGQDGREISTLLYAVSQLGFHYGALPGGTLTRLLVYIATICEKCLFSPMSVANTMHGLSKIGVTWKDITESDATAIANTIANGLANGNTALPSTVSSRIVTSISGVVASMRPDELCSLVQSLTIMKVQRIASTS